MFRSKGNLWILDNQNSFLLAGMLCVLIVFMIVPDDFNYRLLQTGAPTSGSIISRLIWLTLLALGIFFTLWRARLAWLLVRCLNPFLLVFVALAIASVAWSIDPMLTVRRLVRLVTIVLVCSAVVLSGWHARRFQNILRPMLTLVLFGSIIFVVLFPTLAIHQETAPELIGAWHGLATHKNGLGALASITLIFWVHAWLTREVKLLSVLIGCAIAVVCLVMSRSSTALVTTIVVMLFLFMWLRQPVTVRAALPYVVTIITAIILLYGLAVLHLVPALEILLEPITALTGKNLTFTGRTEIWSIIAEHIHYHPMLGTGFAAYWTGKPMFGTDSFVFLTRMQGFYPGSAHNGYLDVINDIGWVGLACLLAYIFTYIRQSLQLLAIDFKQSALYMALFFQQVITNLSESHWFNVLSVDFVFMTFATLALARSLLDHQLHTVFGHPSSSADTSENEMSGHLYKNPEQVHQYRMLAP